mgnify:CR=1 FL=1|jgi:hypothetical protein
MHQTSAYMTFISSSNITQKSEKLKLIKDLQQKVITSKSIPLIGKSTPLIIKSVIFQIF